MNLNTLTTHVQTAQEALTGLLTTLTGNDPQLSVGSPQRTQAEDALQQEMAAQLTLYAAERNVAIALAPGWASVLSASMLGEAIDPDAPGAADLMQEVAAQGVGVVQTALSEAGVQVPQIRFDVEIPGQPIPPLDGPLWRIPFDATPEEGMLGGFVVLPLQSEPDADPTSREPSAAAPSSPGTDEPAGGSVDVSPASFDDLGRETIGDASPSGDGGGPDNFELLAEVKLEVTVELGRRRLPLADVLKLTTGSVVELEKLVGEPLSVYANGRLIAEGEAVVIDEQFGIRITNLASKSRRDKAFF
jgi:flagellar motor switch protein FliN/FliY